MPKITQIEWARATGKIRKYNGIEILDADDENTGKINNNKEEGISEDSGAEKKILFKELKPLN